jgi:hypothetical protein
VFLVTQWLYYLRIGRLGTPCCVLCIKFPSVEWKANLTTERLGAACAIPPACLLQATSCQRLQRSMTYPFCEGLCVWSVYERIYMHTHSVLRSAHCVVCRQSLAAMFVLSPRACTGYSLVPKRAWTRSTRLWNEIDARQVAVPFGASRAVGLPWMGLLVVCSFLCYSCLSSSSSSLTWHARKEGHMWRAGLSLQLQRLCMNWAVTRQMCSNAHRLEHAPHRTSTKCMTGTSAPTHRGKKIHGHVAPFHSHDRGHCHRSSHDGQSDAGTKSPPKVEVNYLTAVLFV